MESNQVPQPEIIDERVRTDNSLIEVDIWRINSTDGRAYEKQFFEDNERKIIGF